MFQKHDLVKVVKQPKMQFARLEGVYGVIIEMDDTAAEIGQLGLDGNIVGAGAVELSCLELAKDASGPMRAAHAVYKQHAMQEELMLEEVESLEKESKKKRKNMLRIIAQRHNMEPKLLRTILKELNDAGVIVCHD